MESSKLFSEKNINQIRIQSENYFHFIPHNMTLMKIFIFQDPFFWS